MVTLAMLPKVSNTHSVIIPTCSRMGQVDLLYWLDGVGEGALQLDNG